MNPGGLTTVRRLEELAALQKHHPGGRLVSRDPPRFEVSLEVGDTLHHVRLVLPPGYPTVPPQVWELEGPGGAVKKTAASHRFGDGSLCVFPHGNDEQGWHPGRLAVEALGRAAELLRREQGGSKMPWYESADRVLVTPGGAMMMCVPQWQGFVMLGLSSSRAGDRLVVAIGEETTGLLTPVSLDDGWWACWPLIEQVPWLRVRLHGRSWDKIFDDSEWLSVALAGCSEALQGCIRAAPRFILVREEAEKIDARMISRDSLKRWIVVSHVIITELDDLLFQRVDGAMEGRARLAETHLVMVGLGSLGSSVALALARAGVRRFTLFDPDILRIENICRHSGTLGDLHRAKVEVVGDQILSVSPTAEVTAVRSHVSWDHPDFGAGSQLEQIWAESGRCVTVVTCAVAEVERTLNAAAVRGKAPVVYAAVLGSGAHGRVFRVIPGETPCYACILTAQAAAPDRFPKYTLPGAASGAAYHAPHLPGLGIDVGQVALLTARVALETALGEESDGQAKLGGDHFLWSNHGGWCFDHPLQRRVVQIERDTECVVCGAGAAAEDPEAAAQLAALERALTEGPCPEA